MEYLLQYLSVAGLSSLDVLAGLGLAVAYGMNTLQIFVCLCLGSMAGVFFFTLFGLRLRRSIHERRRRNGVLKPLNFKKARGWKRRWLRFGLPGIAFLSPPVFSIPVGVLISVIYENRLRRILIAMTISVLFWVSVLAFLGDQLSGLLWNG